MTKENYERVKARKDMREEINDARAFSQSAEQIHLMLFMGACMIQEREAENPHGTAKVLFELTKKQAAEMATS